MKRRFFFQLFSSTLFVPSFVKSSGSADKNDLLNTDKSMSSEMTDLRPGQIFILPKNPSHLTTIFFRNESYDWQTDPPVIKSSNSPIAGKAEPLMLDQNISFGLRYLGKKKGWVFINSADV